MIFRLNRQITLAGEFEGIREGKIEEMPYGYPYFVIKEIYLWREEYYSYPYYYEPYPYWWGGYPYWWGTR